MSLIILPRNTGPEAVEEAQRKLQAAINDPLTVLMIVYGDGPDIDRVVEICSARASVKAMIRRVVWIPDSSVLSDELKELYWRDGHVVVAIGLDDKVAKALTVAEATVRIYVERAFLQAEGQGG